MGLSFVDAGIKPGANVGPRAQNARKIANDLEGLNKGYDAIEGADAGSSTTLKLSLKGSQSLTEIATDVQKSLEKNKIPYKEVGVRVDRAKEGSDQASIVIVPQGAHWSLRDPAQHQGGVVLDAPAVLPPAASRTKAPAAKLP